MAAREISSRQRYSLFRDSGSGAPAAGGDVISMIAAATLLVGDVAYISAANTVNKSLTSSDHDKVIGIVVGGQSIDNSPLPSTVMDESGDVGTTAATVNQVVLILVRGFAYVKVAAAIAAGVSIVADTTTSGRVKAATAIAATAANPTQAATTAANPTQAASSINAGAVAVTSSAANGAIITNGAITAGAITNGAITAGAITATGQGTGRLLGRMIEAGAGAASVALAWINPQ